MKGRELHVCQTHRDNSGAHCLSCQFALEWVCWRQFCHCGEPATGYRTTGADVDVEFFCDEHFVGLEVQHV